MCDARKRELRWQSTRRPGHLRKFLGRRPAEVLHAKAANVAQLFADKLSVGVRHAKVGELGHAPAQQNVFALDIAMHLTAGVQVAQRFGQMHGPAPHVGRRRVQRASEGAALAELQHDGAERLLLIDAHAQQLHHARVVNQRQIQRLPVEGARSLLHDLLLAEVRAPADERHVELLHGHGHTCAAPLEHSATHNSKCAFAHFVLDLQVGELDETRPQQGRQAPALRSLTTASPARQNTCVPPSRSARCAVNSPTHRRCRSR